MHIIERFIQGKDPDQNKCEDGIFVNDDFIAVIDGATSKSEFSNDGRTSGKIATDLILKKFETLATDATAEVVMKALNTAIADWYKEHDLHTHMYEHTVDRCTAGGVIVYSRHFRELWMVGDCQALVAGSTITNEKYIDIMLYDLRSYYLESEFLEGKSIEDLRNHDTGRELIVPLIERQTRFQNSHRNNKFTYAVLDGFFSDLSSIKKVPISRETQEIILATDGYPKIFPTLDVTEKFLTSLLEEDPLLFRKFHAPKGLVPGNHSFDDRAYIRFVG